MALKKILTHGALPERDAFYSSLEAKLFPRATVVKHSRPKLWSLSLMTSGLVFAGFVVAIVYSAAQPKGIALAAAITNTINFTKSSDLLQQTTHLHRRIGKESSDPSSITITKDADGNIVPPSEDFDQVTTSWLYRDNARTDSTIVDDRRSYFTSSLISDVDGVACKYNGSGPKVQPVCNALNDDFSEYFKSFVNENSLQVQDVRIEHSDDPQGDIYLTWETAEQSSKPTATISNGPSGYRGAWYSANSWENEDGVYTHRVNLFSGDIRFNAENGFYPGADSSKFYVQLSDDSGRSPVYLADINNDTLTPASDTELEESRKRYAMLARGFQTSTNALDQDVSLMFGGVTYLKDHESELNLLSQEKAGTNIVYTYAVPESLQLNGGTNNALITKVSFTIDQSRALVVEYHFFDEENVDVESATITRAYPDVDPLGFFTREYWAGSLSGG